MGTSEIEPFNIKNPDSRTSFTSRQQGDHELPIIMCHSVITGLALYF